jgi:hypothetical protein
VIRSRDSLTLSRNPRHLLALATFLLDDRGSFLVVVVVRRSHLALSAAALLGGGRGGGTSLAASVFDLLQSGVGANSHAVDGLRSELSSGFVPVNLFRLVVSVE